MEQQQQQSPCEVQSNSLCWAAEIDRVSFQELGEEMEESKFTNQG